jgi:hypothetical protein
MIFVAEHLQAGKKLLSPHWLSENLLLKKQMRIWRKQFLDRSLTLVQVLDFDTGRLKTPLWKSDGCKACQGNSSFVCVHGECAIPSKYCKGSGGVEDCSLSIQLTWSGTDQRYQVLNSWYQINNLGQYSLYNLYSNLMSSLSNQYNSYFHWILHPTTSASWPLSVLIKLRLLACCTISCDQP